MIYLDNASLKEPKNQVDYVVNLLKNNWYNANSIYQKGIDSKKIIEDTKKII